MEDYKQKYEDAFKVAESIYNDDPNNGTARAVCEQIFSELKESESEDKVMKEKLREILRLCYEGSKCSICASDYKKLLVWLKKQGEQKSADKVESKFKAGDWVVWDNKVVCNITGHIIKGGKKPLMYIITDTNGMERTYSVNDFDNNARLWDITKDAKDGDVLVTLNYIYIFDSIDKKN